MWIIPWQQVKQLYTQSNEDLEIKHLLLWAKFEPKKFWASKWRCHSHIVIGNDKFKVREQSLKYVADKKTKLNR